MLRKLSAVETLPPEAEVAAPEPVDAVFDITDFLRIFRMRRQIILGTAAAIIALTAIVVFQLTPLYTASALVMLDQRKNNVVDVEAVLSGLPTDPSSIENQVQILHSRGLASRVIDKLQLNRDPEFNPALRGGLNVMSWLNPFSWFGGGAVSTLSEEEKAGKQRDAVIDRLLVGISVSERGRSTAIEVDFQSPEPAKAALIGNAIADVYVEDQLNAKFEATQKATQWLANRIQQLSDQVRAAEAAVQQYKADNNITETANGVSIIEQQLTDLNTQLILGRSTLAEQQAKLSRVTELEHSGRSADVTSVVDSPLIGQLRQQETELLRKEAEFSTRYGPRHPQMLDLLSEKRNLQDKINEEVNRVVQTTANDVAIAHARVKSLEDSLAQLEGQSSVQNRIRIKLRELQAGATSSRSLYEAFLSRLKETQGQEGLQTPDARVISRAEVPMSPSFPNKTLIFGIAIPAGFLLGFLLAMLVERLDAGFRTAAQVERLLGLPVLATIPEIPDLAESSHEAAARVVDKPMSSFAEAIRGLQMGLILSNVDRRPKVVLVTSSIPNEGKTTIAISLARLAASSGQRVVIVDSDLRRPKLAETLGVSDFEDGIVEVLSGGTLLEGCLSKDPRSNALFLPAAHKAGNPADLLGSVAMEKLVANLRASFDLTIIDTAPLLPVNDTKVLIHLADTVVFVVRWEKTPREAVVNALQAVASSKASVAGVVLARADVGRFQYYSYGYQNYYTYNKYYSD